MHYVYLLNNDAGHWYIGSATDVNKRLLQHNQGKSRSTAAGKPWKLVYYEAYPTKQLALNRERKLKHHGKGMQELKKRLGLD